MKQENQPAIKSLEARAAERKGLVVYVAGPMTGLQNYHYPTFNFVANALRLRGFQVRNPAAYPHDWNDHALYARLGMEMLKGCNAICVLPGWTTSKGAIDEIRYAVENNFTMIALPSHLYKAAHTMLLLGSDLPRLHQDGALDLINRMADLPVVDF